MQQWHCFPLTDGRQLLLQYSKALVCGIEILHSLQPPTIILFDFSLFSFQETNLINVCVTLAVSIALSSRRLKACWTLVRSPGWLHFRGVIVTNSPRNQAVRVTDWSGQIATHRFFHLNFFIFVLNPSTEKLNPWSLKVVFLEMWVALSLNYWLVFNLNGEILLSSCSIIWCSYCF